jgi:hypothetical protein
LAICAIRHAREGFVRRGTVLRDMTVIHPLGVEVWGIQLFLNLKGGEKLCLIRQRK